MNLNNIFNLNILSIYNCIEYLIMLMSQNCVQVLRLMRNFVELMSIFKY